MLADRPNECDQKAHQSYESVCFLIFSAYLINYTYNEIYRSAFNEIRWQKYLLSDRKANKTINKELNSG